MSVVNIKPFWPMIKNVILPVGIMKIIFVAIAVCYVLILIAGYFWKGHLDGALPLLSVLAFFYLFIMVTLLPAQALTVVSSKSLRYLTDFRRFYFFVAFLLALLYPLVMIIFQWITADPTQNICAGGFCAAFNSTDKFYGFDKLLHLALQVWLLSSGILAGLFYATYRLPILSAPIFMIFVFLKPIFQLLSQLEFMQLFVALIFIWFVFGSWWLRLIPKKYFINNYGMTMEQMLAAGATANPTSNSQAFVLANLLTLGVKPASFLGTRLLGSPDGKVMVIPSWIFTFIIGLLLFLFFRWLMGDNFHKMSDYVCIYSSVFLFYVGASSSLNAICRNIKPLWLFYPGTREQMFLFIEKKCLSYALALILISPLYFLVFSYLAGTDFNGISIVGGVTISVVLLCALNFYSSIAIYARDKDRKLGFSGGQGITLLMTCLLLAIISYLLIGSYYFSVLVINSIALVALLVLRNRITKKWPKINFVQVS